jgi:hypothetical protein
MWAEGCKVPPRCAGGPQPTFPLSGPTGPATSTARASGRAHWRDAHLESVPKRIRGLSGTVSKTARPPVRPFAFGSTGRIQGALSCVSRSAEAIRGRIEFASMAVPRYGIRGCDEAVLLGEHESSVSEWLRKGPELRRS